MSYYRYRENLWSRWSRGWRHWRGTVPRPHPATVYQMGYRLMMYPDAVDQFMRKPYRSSGYRYRHFTKPKKDGSLRELAEPEAQLKAAQKRLLRNILDHYALHSSTIGFRQGGSTAKHAWTHAGAALIITADIEDFFPNTTAHRVYEFWMQQMHDDAVSQFLTLLTTYQDCLPQGAPTSPMLSNLVNREMDERMFAKTQESGGRYTRYGDDLAFSWADGFEPPANFEASVRQILLAFGYHVNPQKGWGVWRREDEPQITGIILQQNGEVDMPNALKQTMKALSRAKTPADQRRYQGYAAYYEMIKRR